jgi:uncharacterized membrane protein
MFSLYNPIVQATITFLKLLKVNVNNTTVNESLQDHPDWPSLLCIADSLNKWKVPNTAAKVELEQIQDIPTPFIAHINNSEFPFAVVVNITDTSVELYSKNYRKSFFQNRNEFLKSWNGVCLIAEPTDQSGEANYIPNKRKNILSTVIYASLFLLLSTLSFIYVKTNADNSFINNKLSIYLQCIILFSGIIVTSILLWYEIDKNNPILHKVCNNIIKGNCGAILTSKSSKVFSWLSWSEVGFFYFTGGFLTMLLADNTANNSIIIIAWLNILALPYTFFSIYFQGRIAKHWCIFCITVQVLLILGGVNVISSSLYYLSSSFSVFFFSKTALLYLVPILLWYSIKPYILNNQDAKNKVREYQRIKFNTEIFETLLYKQKQISESINGLGIDLGNSNAKNLIIKVCNPYCNPCSQAHPKIERLLEDNDNIKAKIIFTTPNMKEAQAYKPTTHLLAIASKNTEDLTKRALKDWYLADKKDYDAFAVKYPLNGELYKQGDRIDAMHTWCNKNDIQFTPTYFINGYQLPDGYSIDDLNHLLRD